MRSGAGPWKVVGWIRPEPFIAVVLWGGIYPAAKVGLAEIPPLVFTYLRVVLAAAVLTLASGRRHPGPPSRDLRTPLLGAGLAQAAFQLLLIAGLARTTAGASAILLAASPLIAAGWLALTRRERISAHHWAGLAVGLAGVALVVGGDAASFGRAHLAGNLVAVCAAAAWVLYSLAIEPLAGALGAMRATKWAMIIAVVVLTPFALAATLRLDWHAVSWAAWAGVAYGATAGMVVAMTLWGRAMHALGPRQTMVYAYLEPVSAVAIAAVLLGETLAPAQVVGALMTFTGVWFASAGRAGADTR